MDLYDIFLSYVACGSWVCQGYFPFLTAHSGINLKHPIMPQGMSQQEAEKTQMEAPLNCREMLTRTLA